jgi:hypothetical protein
MNGGNSLCVIHNGDTDLHGQQDDRPKDHAAAISRAECVRNRRLAHRLGAPYPRGAGWGMRPRTPAGCTTSLPIVRSGACALFGTSRRPSAGRSVGFRR